MFITLDGPLSGIKNRMMKILPLIPLICFVLAAVHPLSGQHTLRLEVSGLKKPEGNLMVAVFDSEKTFLSEDRVKGIIVEVDRAGQVNVDVPGLPFGHYAVSVYHDENGNGQLDTNFLGIPRESYGFSNNARGTMGPPKFEAARFDFRQDSQVHSIVLH